MLAKIEINDEYLNKIMSGQSDILKLKYEKEYDDYIEVVFIDQAGVYYGGKVVKNDKGHFNIIGDTEFKRVYPVIDIKTKQILRIEDKEE